MFCYFISACFDFFNCIAGDVELQKYQDEQAEEEWILKALMRVGLQEISCQARKAKRRSSTATRALSFIAPPNDSHQQYLQRAKQRWPGMSWSVIDSGMIAGTTINACFWLSVVAAWSRLPRTHYDASELVNLQEEVLQLAHCLPADFNYVNRQAWQDDLGEAASKLRALVTGPDGYMRAPERMKTWTIAFAALQASSPDGEGMTTQQYYRWLDKVSCNEFADELILAATAEYLKLCIVVVPYTPSDAPSQWAIVEHPCKESRQSQNIDETRVVVLGNDDVHYATDLSKQPMHRNSLLTQR